jgi:hypothetical protein
VFCHLRLSHTLSPSLSLSRSPSTLPSTLPSPLLLSHSPTLCAYAKKLCASEHIPSQSNLRTQMPTPSIPSDPHILKFSALQVFRVAVKEEELPPEEAPPTPPPPSPPTSTLPGSCTQVLANASVSLSLRLSQALSQCLPGSCTQDNASLVPARKSLPMPLSLSLSLSPSVCLC